jgi:DNA polymerase-3 subunit alpha
VDLRKVGKRALESLIQVGALECLGGTRAQHLAVLDRIMQVSQQTHDQANQLSMFSLDAFATSSTRIQDTLPDEFPLADQEKRALEKDLIGFYLTPHPMQQRMDELASRISAYSGELATLPHQKMVTLVGIVAWIRPLTTKSGKSMAIVGMEDAQGSFEMVVFPRDWQQYREMIATEKVLLVRGEVDNSRGEGKILVRSLDDNPTIYRAAGDEDPPFEPDQVERGGGGAISRSQPENRVTGEHGRSNPLFPMAPFLSRLRRLRPLRCRMIGVWKLKSLGQRPLNR